MPAKEIIHNLVLAAIGKLNLVTREEYDTQTQVLYKTRLRVEQLENKLSQLQAQQQQFTKIVED
jgi:BMFP domain-containing protein YqiC